MQDTHVTAFINQQPPKLRNILSALRTTILQSGLSIEESIKYGLPFYSYYGQLCFLNPRDEIVLLGLCKGAALSNTQGLLEGDGKEVRHVRIRNLSDIHQELSLIHI